MVQYEAMAQITDNSETFLSIRATAIRLGLPAAWLKHEALAGRIPYLRAGRRLLVNPIIVEQLLIQRAGDGMTEKILSHGRIRSGVGPTAARPQAGEDHVEGVK